MKQWGAPGNKPGEFNTPHGIASDAQGKSIYVARISCRGRIQVFKGDGTFIREIKTMPSEVPVPPDAKPWMGNPNTAQS